MLMGAPHSPRQRVVSKYLSIGVVSKLERTRCQSAWMRLSKSAVEDVLLVISSAFTLNLTAAGHVRMSG